MKKIVLLLAVCALGAICKPSIGYAQAGGGSAANGATDGGDAHGGDFVASDLVASMNPAAGDRAALLVVHFGTTYDDTRAATIDAINDRARAAFPDLEVREAYTSRIVIRRLRARGIERHTPLEALLRLRADGYTHVVIQSTNIIEGVEMESLRRDAASVEPFFKEVRIGNPLLYSVEDFETVVSALAELRPARGSVVLVGHGTTTPITATYAMIDYMFNARGIRDFHVGTVEGYPTFETMLARLKASRAREVTLVPLMFVAGDHARNDIDGEWREALEREGFKVSTRMEGLGQNPAIQDIFIDHARFVLHHRPIGIMEKKAGYAAAKD